MARADLSDRLRKLEERDRDVQPWTPPVAVPALVDFARASSIVQKEGETETGLIPFDLWPEQEMALYEMEVARQLGKGVVAVKGRQVGLTWLDLVFWLYHGTFWQNRMFLIGRQSEDYAKDAIKRLLTLRTGLPPEWRVPLTTQNLTTLEFANGCRFEALTATKRLARGLAAFGFLADEFAFWDWQPDQLAAIESAAANVHIVTTGNGEELTYKIWEDAIAGKGSYVPIFIPSSADPRRDEDWRRIRVEESAEPRLARREHAECPADAFSAPEGVFFERWNPEEGVQEFEFDRHRRTYLFIDWGWAAAAVLIAQTTSAGQLLIVDEYIVDHEKISEWVPAVLSRLTGYDPDWVMTDCFGDPAGRGRNPQTAESDIDVFERCSGLHFHGEGAGVRDGTVRLIEEIAAVENPLRIHPRCKHLKRALDNIKPDPNKPDLYDERSKYTHVLDALRYGVWNLATEPGHWDQPVSDRPISGGLYGSVW